MKIDIKEHIKIALMKREPVVALESTIISHGMPYPQNLEMAKKVEQIVRDNGGIPATIAIIDGVIKVGLDPEELEVIAKSKDVLKVSKRDFGYCISQKRTGATTVSGTMIVADFVGIKVFATGGIGGVHRGASESFDISRDLEDLGDLEVAVVCAGAKSILDLGLTLEYLETKGVEVIGYKTDKLPAFYTKSSEHDVLYRLDTTKEIAHLLGAKWQLMGSGAVIVNPIPDEFSIEEDKINKAINEALKEADKLGIKGKENTPYLLAKIKEITKGKSLEANLALVYNNAKVATLIAKDLSEYEKSISDY